MSKRLGQGEFIRRARKIHGNKYGYAAVRYRNIDAKVKINCPKHGYFFQSPWVHAGKPKSGCPKCGDIRAGQKRKNKNAERFVREARRVHGNKYDYSKAVYRGINIPLCVICPKHGAFWPSFSGHIRLKSGCPKCSKTESAARVIEKFRKAFVKKAKKVHGDAYDYSETKYAGAFKALKIRCKRHGTFTQMATNHLNGYGCEKCGRERLQTLFSFPRKEFIGRAKKLHGSRYSYLGDYKNNYTPFKLRCPVHGIFYQRPQHHLNGHGCGRCSMIEAGIRKRVTHREFLKKVKRIHPQYTFTEKYNKAVQKIKVRCPKHGLFQTSPNALLSGYGCPICSESYGEREVSRILTQMRIRFIRQKKFPDLQHKRPLRFDFWLPYHKTLIEYDGVQHFQASTFFGGKKAYKATKVRDRLKTLWARRMKFPLIRIPYTHPMPEQILENKLKR